MESKLNSGVAFKNDYKKEDKHPDYKGTVNVDGVEKAIAVWKREKNGKEYFSFAFSEPYKKHNKPTPKKEEVQDKDGYSSLPF